MIFLAGFACKSTVLMPATNFDINNVWPGGNSNGSSNAVLSFGPMHEGRYFFLLSMYFSIFVMVLFDVG